MIGAVITLIQDEARRIWCYRWLVAGVAAATFCVAALYVLHLPNVYEAWGQLLVNKQTPLATAAEGVSLVGENYGSPYVVQRTLLNDDNLEKVVVQLDPGAAPRGKSAMAAATARLRTKIMVTPDQGDGFVELHYRDVDPVRARNVIQLMLNQFISRNVDRSRNDLDRASKFLDTQLASYEKMIADSQVKLDDYRHQHPGVASLALETPVLSEPAAGPVFQPGAAPQATVAAPPPVAPSAPSPASEKIAALSGRLAGLRTQYTDEYPDVVSTKRQLAEAMAERAQERAAAPPPAAVGGPTVAIPAARRPVAAWRPRRRGGAPAVSPAVRAQWTDLQRSDEVLHANYQQLVARREATRMSQAVYGADGSGKYQVTRTPTVPDLPAGPNRKLYLVLAALAALGAGVGVGYLRAAMKGILVSPRELEEAFHLPVVGTVSWEPAWNTSPVRRPSRALTVAGGVGMAVVAAFALLLIFDTSGSAISTLESALQGVVGSMSR